jgi:hypothetical protein
MKILATLTILFSLTVLHPAAPLLPQSTEATTRAAQPHGKWYLAENGHAVFCYGPVQVVRDPITGVQRVATFCKGDRVVVPLKD